MKVGLVNERPEQPPEGALIAAALERSDLSIRQAAERAGISYGRWRQVATGVQHVSPGEYAAVRAPALTLAKMARAVGVTPDQLETEGKRPDAAEALRDLEQHSPPAPAPAVPDPFEAARPPGWANSFITVELVTFVAENAMPAIKARINELRAAGIAEPDGDQVFGENAAAAVMYDSARMKGGTVEQAAWDAALTVEWRDRRLGQRRTSRRGSAGA